MDSGDYTGLGTSRETWELEALGQVLAQAPDAEGLGGVSAGDRVHVRLPGHVQAVDAVADEALGFERAVELSADLGGGGGYRGDDGARAGVVGGTHVGYCWGVGAWRSLVARTVRVGEVPSSNLGAPIG